MKHPYKLIEMTSGLQPWKWPVVILAMLCLCCPLQIGAQTDNGPASINMSSITWKSTPEINQVIITENERIDLLLTTPNLQQDEQSAYKAYKIMLTYTQQHIANDVPVSDAISKGYQQVLNEVPKSPELAKLPDHLLGTYLPALVEMLTAVPVPVSVPR